MRLVQLITLVVTGAGAVVMSQAPEFAQQYRQRLGGALEELAEVVAGFDADAARYNLDREQALEIHRQATEPFLRDRGVSMEAVLRRLDRLHAQARHFEELPPFLRPVALAYPPDERVLEGTFQDFRPAVPVTVDGAVWAGAGGFVGWLMGRILTLPFRRRRRALAHR
jgi:hypothetical protein